MDSEKNVSRRAVLCGLAVLTLGLIPENAIAASGVKVLANGKVVVNLSKNPALKKVGGVVQFTNNKGIDIALVRTGKGVKAFRALNLACTHQGYPLRLEGDKWVCDNHLANFSITGAVTKGPAESNLQNIPLKATKKKITVG
ncbi:MAG: Rieske (2Fe-2S) protein [Candidatus Nanopelagicaceae bacterium]|jgi:Rieske Fe-S protein|nr:Rieske (2Fe-2S) protein [Candidatus Nanopelagicales bacterium]MDP4653508.1 Rieske (2Fe-2S) protein [Candidatus Nanopelagicales bacterium]MDP4864372.1 Rieske (2Fe-2S) protein [Candidatus Nanopelagicaceae bacterium]